MFCSHLIFKKWHKLHNGNSSTGNEEASLYWNAPTPTLWGGWGCEVSCGGHHRQRGKTTTGSALDGAVLDFTQILSYLVHNMSRSQLYLGFGHFGWLPSTSVNNIFRLYGSIVFHLLKLLSFFWLTYYCSIGPCFSVRVSYVIADTLCKLIQSLFLQWFVNLMGALTFLLFIFYIFFLKVNCGL